MSHLSNRSLNNTWNSLNCRVNFLTRKKKSKIRLKQLKLLKARALAPPKALLFLPFDSLKQHLLVGRPVFKSLLDYKPSEDFSFFL